MVPFSVVPILHSALALMPSAACGGTGAPDRKSQCGGYMVGLPDRIWASGLTAVDDRRSPL
jgi:hypothetical protein